jgi:glycosyltransferase involved in cell wall biosynthesis
VVRLFAPWVGGMERQALKLASTMNELGIADARIVTGRWFRATSANEVIDGVAVHRTAALWGEQGIRGLRKPGAIVFMVSLLIHLLWTRQTFDVIHVHGLSYHTAVCRLVSRITGTPMIVKLANAGEASDIAKMSRGQHFPGTRLMLGPALAGERYVALNRMIRAELEEAGVDDVRVVEIPNGVAVAEAPRMPPAEDVMRLVFVGRLHPQKSLDTVLDAMTRMPCDSANGGVVLDVIGDGPDRERLAALVRAQGLDGCVVFHGSTQSVEPFLQAADALVLPSRAEGLSNALLEAMAMGVPAIVSDIPGNTNVVTDGRTGFVFRTGDAADLADLMCRLMLDRNLLVEAGRMAHEEARQAFALSTIARRYRKEYEVMLTGGTRKDDA